MLTSPRAAQASTWWWLPVVLLGLVGLLLIGALANGIGTAGTGWWGPMHHHPGGPTNLRSPDAPAPLAGAEQITITAGEMWFDPGTIEVVAGTPVNLTVVNHGEVFHDLTIEEFDVRLDVASGQSDTAGVTIDEPAEYALFCSVPGHAAAGMRGTLTVVGPPR